MLKTEHEIYMWALEKSEDLTKEPKGTIGLTDYIYENYKIPQDIITDIIMLRMEEVGATQDMFIMFALVDGLYHVWKFSYNPLERFFTPIEIEQWKNKKYKTLSKKDIFPIILPMIQINSDQWIGKVDADWLFTMSKIGLINYNEDTQRPLFKYKKGTKDKEYYRIDTNPVAIRGIREAYRTGHYISNDITLNMGDKSEEDFDYDPDNQLIIINSIKKFDIVDGYHRYYGAYQEKQVNPDLKINFILHLTNFSEEKARQYIFQQDIRTPIKRKEISSYNQTTPETKVVEMITDPMSGNVWNDYIKRNHKGKIDYADLVNVVKGIYFFNRKDVATFEIKKAAKEIINGFKILDFELDEVPVYDIGELIPMIYCIHKGCNAQQIIEGINIVCNDLDYNDIAKIDIKRGVTKKLIDRIKELIG